MVSYNYKYESFLEAGHGVSFKGQVLKWDTAADVAPVVDAINNCKNLKYLELEGNTISVDAAKEIGKALESHPELEFALWKDMFTGRLKTEIPEALKYLFVGVDLAGAKLHRLDLSDNAVGPMALPGIIPFFQTPSSFTIKEIIFNNQGMGETGGKMCSQAFLDCYETSLAAGGEVFQPKVIMLGRNRQDIDGTLGWAKFFKKVGSLEEIHMPQNGITLVGIQALTEGFKMNPGLRVLNLEDNTVLPAGVQVLSEVFPITKDLEELNLGDCLIKSKGAKILSIEISKLTNLKSLKVPSNEIKRQAGIQLAAVLRLMSSLVEVNMSGNEIGDQGVEEITHLLADINCEIEDDEGEGDEADEEEENDNQIDLNGTGDSDRAEAYLSLEDFSFDATSDSRLNGSTTFYSMLDNVVENATEKLFIQEVLEEDPVTTFMNSPSLDNYVKLLPNVEFLISANFQQIEDKSTAGIKYLNAAILISKLALEEGQELFDSLMADSLECANTPNEFVTNVLIALQLIQSEKSKEPVETATGPTYKALSTMLANEKLTFPVVLFHVLDCFLSLKPNTETQDLIDVVKKRLEVTCK